MNEFTPEVQAVRDRQITDRFQIATLKLTTKRIEVSVYSDCLFIEFTDGQFVRFDLQIDSDCINVNPTIPITPREMASFKLITAEQHADQQRHDDEYFKFYTEEQKARREKEQHDEYIRLKAIYEPSKQFQVWSEGYDCTGQSSGAIFHGVFEGETFKDAVAAFAATLDEDHRKTINLDHLTYWGCKFYDNEADARKIYG